MSEKILYYIGAGASAEALPLVNFLPKSFRQMADVVRKENLSTKKQEFLNQFADDLESLANQSIRFTTIDTYAKYLYLKNREKLKELKIALSTYFSLEQLWNRKIDSRYLIWLTSILNLPIFPDNIKILTWNYDFQMELTAERFQSEELRHSHGVSIHSPPLIPYYPPIGNTFSTTSDNYNPNEISLIHLNGIAGFYQDGRSNHNENLFLNYVEEDRENLLDKLIINSQDKHNLLTFAWEADTRLGNRIKFAEHIAAETTILVVIGYSFPFFNREIDKRIFKAMKSSGKLKKIYFQDPILDGSFLKNQFDLDIDPVHIDRVNSFFIPFEL